MTDHGLAQVTHDIEQAVASIPLAQLPALLGSLEKAKAVGWGRMHTGPAPKTGEAEKLLLTMTEAAKRLSIPESRAYELARQQKLPAVRMGKNVRVRVHALVEYVARLPKA